MSAAVLDITDQLLILRCVNSVENGTMAVTALTL
jgi:hypothetical protein